MLLKGAESDTLDVDEDGVNQFDSSRDAGRL